MNEIEQYIIKEYDAGKSTYEICELLNAATKTNSFYPNKINRFFKRIGKKIRSRQESQSLVLSSGRATHPTKGKKRSGETKLKISKGISEAYQNNPLAKERRSDLSKKAWEKLTTKQKDDMRSNGAKAIRRTSDEGSKIEKYLLLELKRNGYEVVFHSTSLIPKQSLEIDMFLPAIKTVIEIDGISHFEPVWGEASFERTKKSDQEKNGIVLQWYNMVRLQANSKKVTAAYCRKVFDRLYPTLESIKNQGGLLPMEERLIFIKEEQ